MPVLFVARSAKLARWASDVGFGKHVYKVGVTDEDPKALAASGWAGETDWKIVRRDEVEGLSEAEALERLSRKEKPIDPNIYPKLKGASGVFRVAAEHVENHIIVVARPRRRQRAARSEAETGRFRRLSDPQRDARVTGAPPCRAGEVRGLGRNNARRRLIRRRRRCVRRIRRNPSPRGNCGRPRQSGYRRPGRASTAPP